MRWKEGRRSENVEDRRGITPAGIAIGGGIGTLLLALAAIFLGADPRQVLNALQQEQQQAPAGGGGGGPAAPRSPEEEERVDFVKVVLAETEDVWTDLFKKAGKEYQKPILVTFDGKVLSACGRATASVGPFYCPADSKVYLDVSFFQGARRAIQITRRFPSGLRRRPRNRSSRPKPARHQQQSARGAESGEQGRSRRTIGPARASSRFLCRGVGTPCPQAAADSRGGRRRTRIACRGGDRRRPDSARRPGLCRARDVHARLVEATCQVVPERPGNRGHESRQHI